MKQEHQVLDTAISVIAEGPVRSTPAKMFPQRPHSTFVHSHERAFRAIGSALSVRVLVALHNDNTKIAWTNLVALTRLVTQWQPDPTQVFHSIRFDLIDRTFEATWEALQADGWRGEHLLTLQTSWESMELWERLPDTAAFLRFELLEFLELEREGFSREVIQILKNQGRALSKDPAGAAKHLKMAVMDVLSRVNYQAAGTYADEHIILRSLTKKEKQLKQAIEVSTWAEMQMEPGAIKAFSLSGASGPRVVKLADTRTLTPANGHAPSELIAQAAIAESQRRLVITALALHRYHLNHDCFPSSLDALAPEFLEEVPLDFMDGEPLRYRTTDDGHFVLWSVGLDCIDDHGTMSFQMASGPSLSAPMGDIVWPRPATEEEMVVYRKEINEVLAWVRGEVDERPPDDLLQKHGYGWQATTPH